MTCAGSAEKADPDPSTTEDEAAESSMAHGIGEVPQDRGIELVTRLADCPLPEAATSSPSRTSSRRTASTS